MRQGYYLKGRFPRNSQWTVATMVKETIQLILGYVRSGQHAHLREVASASLVDQLERLPPAVNMALYSCIDADVTYLPEYYRRITNSRLQGKIAVGDLTYLFESTSIGAPCWILQRLSLNDSDDDEYYWRRWCNSVEEADADYDEYSRNPYKDDNKIDLEDLISLKQSVRAMQGSVSAMSSTTTSTLSSSSEDDAHYHYPSHTETLPTVTCGPPSKPELQCLDPEDLYWQSYDDVCIY